MTRAIKSALVTGGAGFIGSNFVHRLAARHSDARMITLDALTYAGNRENLRGLPADRHTFIHGDIRDAALVRRLLVEYDIDTIVHFAAESHVDRSIHGPEAFIETNVAGTHRLLEVAREAWVGRSGIEGRRFHHVSTDEVFGSLGPGEPAFHEGTPYAPRSPYAASKAASDHLVRAWCHTYGLPVTISNCSNNYGPRQFPEKLIPLVICNAMTGLPLPVYGDGAQVRDWIHVEDGCDAILAILTRGRMGETYNLGGGNQPTNLEIIRRLCAYLDERVPTSKYRPHASLIRFVADRPGHDRRYAIDGRKIEAELGWAPRRSLEEGLRETVDWYLANPDWLAAVTGRDEFSQWMAVNYGDRGGS